MDGFKKTSADTKRYLSGRPHEKSRRNQLEFKMAPDRLSCTGISSPLLPKPSSSSRKPDQLNFQTSTERKTSSAFQHSSYFQSSEPPKWQPRPFQVLPSDINITFKLKRSKRKSAQPNLATKIETKSNSASQNNEKSERQISKLQISPIEREVNIPENVIHDQYGICGPHSFIKHAHGDKKLKEIGVGVDIDTFPLDFHSKLNFNERKSHETFNGPWGHENGADPVIPPEYLQPKPKKLKELRASECSEDILFYLYYTGSDKLKLFAIGELYRREWRFNKILKIWMTDCCADTHMFREEFSEKGVFYYFDEKEWMKKKGEFTVDHTMFGGKPEWI